MVIFIFRSVLVYTHCTEQTLLRIKQVCCITEFHFGKFLFYKQTQALTDSCWSESFVCGWKFYYQLQIRHLNVLLKIEDRKLLIVDVAVSLVVMMRGHGVKFFLNVYCLAASMLLVVYKKDFAIFCSQLASWLVTFLPTGPVAAQQYLF